jgi:hypothetical protein
MGSPPKRPSRRHTVRHAARCRVGAGGHCTSAAPTRPRPTRRATGGPSARPSRRWPRPVLGAPTRRLPCARARSGPRRARRSRRRRRTGLPRPSRHARTRSGAPTALGPPQLRGGTARRRSRTSFGVVVAGLKQGRRSLPASPRVGGVSRAREGTGAVSREVPGRHASARAPQGKGGPCRGGSRVADNGDSVGP